MLEVVLGEARSTADISPEANAALIEYSDLLAGRQSAKPQVHNELAGTDAAWRANRIACEKSASNEKYRSTGSGR